MRVEHCLRTIDLDPARVCARHGHLFACIDRCDPFAVKHAGYAPGSTRDAPDVTRVGPRRRSSTAYAAAVAASRSAPVIA